MNKKVAFIIIFSRPVLGLKKRKTRKESEIKNSCIFDPERGKNEGHFLSFMSCGNVYNSSGEDVLSAMFLVHSSPSVVGFLVS